jgi:hypothetical protein
MSIGSTLRATVSAGLIATSALAMNDTAVAQLIFGQRCQTVQGWCFMAAPGPVGGQCFCPSPLGPIVGFIVQ